MNFETTDDTALWDRASEQVYAIRRNGREFTTGTPRSLDAEPEWLPIVVAYPEDMVPGHAHMLGPATFEVDPTYDRNVVIESFPEADFSPEGFRDQAEAQVFEATRQALSDTDSIVVECMELGVDVPQDIRDARDTVRGAKAADLARLDGLVPAEFPEFAPQEVISARNFTREVVRARRDAERGRPPREPGKPDTPGGRGRGRA